MCTTTWIYLLMSCLPCCYRICSGTDDILRLSSTFIESLLRTSSRHWIDQVKRRTVDIFTYNVLIMPYQCGMQKSLFVVLGANNIKWIRTSRKLTKGKVLFCRPRGGKYSPILLIGLTQVAL